MHKASGNFERDINISVPSTPYFKGPYPVRISIDAHDYYPQNCIDYDSFNNMQLFQQTSMRHDIIITEYQ